MWSFSWELSKNNYAPLTLLRIVTNSHLWSVFQETDLGCLLIAEVHKLLHSNCTKDLHPLKLFPPVQNITENVNAEA